MPITGGVLEQVVADLTSFLRKALRPLRAASLGSLEVRVTALARVWEAPDGTVAHSTERIGCHPDSHFP